MSNISDQETRLKGALSDAGFEQSGLSTATSKVWVNKANKRALTVPDACDGFYPSWMLDDLETKAREIGEMSVAETVGSFKNGQA